jgi:LuxR family maltose regulon positive regulatory protein
MTAANPTRTADAGLTPALIASGGMVFRDGLLAQLGAAARVTQISAPAGSGKTSLLRSWIGAAGLADRAAWVCAQGRDQQQFWTSVADALRETSVAAPLVRAATATADPGGRGTAERLLADLSSLPDRIWLVIDDVHELDSSETLSQLELLVRHGPAELRLVLATRGEARLGLHRLRLEGELTEIRGADLRFTLEEARALLGTSGVELPESALVLLHERTEGWAAGLRLAALSLAGHPDPERFAAEFSGSDRTVSEYLLAEVLDRQPEEVRQLLLRTSVLEQVSGPLADVLRGRSGGERILQQLEQAGAFVVAVDGRRSWFRYHQLFAELLQRELRCSAPGELPALHLAAARWYAEHGHLVEAVQHAQAAQDWDLAVRSLGDHLLDLVLSGQSATVGKLLAGFPAGACTAAAELAALTAGDEVTRGSLAGAERQLALAGDGSASVPADRRGRFEVVVAIVRLTVASHRGDLPAVAEQAQRLLTTGAGATLAETTSSVTGLGEDLRALTLVRLGAAELWSLHAEGAERHLELAVALARRVGRPFLEASALAHSAWAASFRSFALALERGTEAVELAERHGWTEDPALAVGYLALGASKVWQLRLAEAASLLDQAERALVPELQPAAGLLLGQTRGMLALAHGRDAEALAAYQGAEPLTGLLAASSTHPATLLLRAHTLQAFVRLGEIGRAEQTLAELAGQQREHGEIRVAEAALRLAQGVPRAATAALAPVLDGSAPVPNDGWAIQAFLLEAVARDALGHPAETGRALEHALNLAARDGAVFAFVAHPAPELLRHHAGHCAAHVVLISEILSLLAPAMTPAAEAAFPQDHGELGGASHPLVEPLTDSEARILRYLPTNLSAPEMADQLCVSVNTVRTHMRHVYEKLGAHRRADAVDRARGLGLLTPSPHRP